jgi:hypothetical protein
MAVMQGDSRSLQMPRPLSCIPVAQVAAACVNVTKISLLASPAPWVLQAPLRIRAWDGEKETATRAQHAPDLPQDPINTVTALKDGVGEDGLVVREPEVVCRCGRTLSMSISSTGRCLFVRVDVKSV